MPKGLLNPKNFAPDTGGGFKEGIVRIDRSVFKVHKYPDPEKPPKGYVPRAPVCALMWEITRLDEDLDVMTTDEGAPITEVLPFSLGGKSIAQVHPGKADSPDDEEPEDQGVEVNAEGNTVFLINHNFQIHPKSGAAHLFASLKEKGFAEEYLDRVWAPDFEGMVCFLKNVVDDSVMMKQNDGTEKATAFKTVDKIITFPYKKKGGKSEGKTEAKGDGKTDKAEKGEKADPEVEGVLKPILEALSTELDGTQISRKALNNRVATAMQKAKVNSKLQIPALDLLKSDAWLKKNSVKYDMTIDFEDNTIVFGTLKDE